MGLVLARIDQRLVHGIVVTQWASATKAKRIMVVDDAVAADESRKAVMRLSKPAGTGMSLIDTQTAITNFAAGKYDNHNVLLVVDNVEILKTLIENGVKVPKINVGIMLDRDDRKKYTTHFAASEGELAMLKELDALGIPVTVQFTPGDKAEPINKFN